MGLSRVTLVCLLTAFSAIAEDAATHWAFVAPVRANAPAVSNAQWVRNPIDAFVLSRLEAEGIAPSPEASRETLLRRVSLDLIGLPPALDELDTYLADTSPDSYERQIDRLLNSPHFGEKWARWWLDLSGYADSDGYLSDFLRPNAWHYRQWVVDAFNTNKPFDQFTTEQLAGDLLPNATTQQRIGTGILRNTMSNREGGADLEEFRVRQIVARASMVGTAWLGLTIGCAQCHDHKFDPISQREFFGMYAFFNTSDEVNVNAPVGDELERHLAARPAYDAKRAEILAPAIAEIEALQAEWERRMLEAANNPDTADATWARQFEVLGLVWGQNFGEGQHEGIQIVKVPVAERTQDQKDRLLDYFLQNGSLVNEAKWAELKLPEVWKQLDELAKTLPRVSRAPAMVESKERRMTHLHRRGDFRAPGEEVPPHTPAVVLELEERAAPTRLDLAQWLVHQDNPLTARVFVNRVWHELFGRGLVSTTEDFGTRGEKPSHPELLDWLAVDFMDSGWDVKQLLRTIMTSSAYRQSSDRRLELNDRDPNNVLIARQSRNRLSAEIVRDNALAASGLLNATIGGPSVRPPQPDSVSMEGFDNKWVASEGADRYRRGLYTFIQRTSPFGQSVTFDLPDPGQPCTRRDRSNTPLQALNLLNDPLFVECAQSLAQRVEAFMLRRMREGEPVNVEDCVNHAFRIALSRDAKPEERARLSSYLAQQAAIFERESNAANTLIATRGNATENIDSAAWMAVCSVILNLDEFITRE
ncbi:MAG TPA: DUF1549 and DUF1553 domain-containing protein [Candidatus Hydrogenedentes bacterium]|nr:DUF1549 and DUF1553 domain-containing protein [Candidatus Hydrogenedentota bacterium]